MPVPKSEEKFRCETARAARAGGSQLFLLKNLASASRVGGSRLDEQIDRLQLSRVEKIQNVLPDYNV